MPSHAPPPTVMPLYSRTGDLPPRWRRAVSFAGKVALAALYGVLTVFLPPRLLFVLILPIVILLLVALWLMPDRGVFPLAAIERLYPLYLILSVVWPVYIAVVLPGLPWLTPTRFVLFLVSFVFMYSISTSGALRRHLGTVARSSRGIWITLLLFQLAMVISIPFSRSIGTSLKMYFDDQLRLTEMFFLGCLIFARRGAATWTVGALVVLAIVCSIDGAFIEFPLGYPPWANHIPSFMRVDEATMANVLGSQARSADGIYRVRGPFPLSLVLAEYLALCSPFVLHWFITGRSLLLRLAMAVSWVLIGYAIVLTQSRLGLVGAIVGHAVYLPLWAFRRWRTDRSALLGPFVLFGAPFLAIMMLGVIFSSHTLTQRVLGGGASAASDASRAAQRAAAIPKILNNPVGHGIGQSAQVLGLGNQAGMLSVDNHYITTGLDFGFLGLFGLYGMFVVAVWTGLRLYLASSDREVELAGPLAVMFVVFLFIKSVLSQENNHSIVFLLLGMLIALLARERRLVDADNLFPRDPLLGVSPPAGARSSAG